MKQLPAAARQLCSTGGAGFLVKNRMAEDGCVWVKFQGSTMISMWVSGFCSALWAACIKDDAVIAAPCLETSLLAGSRKPSVKIKSCVPEECVLC